jgi:ribonuclease Z
LSRCGDVEIVFLGTGGSVPTRYRNTSATAVRVGPEIVLIDCGEGTQRQLMNSTVSFMKITRIFVTHLHGDHFLGLPGLIQSMNFAGRLDPLHIYGPEGTAALVGSVLHLGYFQAGFQVSGHDIEDQEMVQGKGYTVKAVRTDHTVPSFGFVLAEDIRPGRFNKERAMELGVPVGPLFSKLQSGSSVTVKGGTITPEMVMGDPRPGLRVAFSGDTRPCEHFMGSIIGCDVLVHEATADASLREKANEFGHSTAREAATIASLARVKTLYLNHFSGRYEDIAFLVDEARVIFPNTYASEDLMIVQVNHDDTASSKKLQDVRAGNDADDRTLP